MSSVNRCALQFRGGFFQPRIVDIKEESFFFFTTKNSWKGRRNKFNKFTEGDIIYFLRVFKLSLRRRKTIGEEGHLISNASVRIFSD